MHKEYHTRIKAVTAVKFILNCSCNIHDILKHRTKSSVNTELLVRKPENN